MIGVIVAVALLTSGPKGEAGFPSEQYEGIEVMIPVNIEGAAGVGSLHFELVYDWSVLRALEVEYGMVVGDAMFEYNVDVPGRVMVGIIDSSGISGDGSVAVVAFQLRGEADAGISLELENIVAYDAATMTEIPTTASAGSFTTENNYTAPTLLLTP